MNLPWQTTLELILDTAAIQALVLAFLFFSRRNSAAAEHSLLSAAVITVLVVTAVSPLVEPRHLRLVPIDVPAATPAFQAPAELGARPEAAAPGVATAAPADLPRASFGPGLPMILATTWVSGSLVCLLWIAAGLLYSWRLSVRARTTDSRVAQDRFRWALGKFGLRPDLVLAESDSLRIPVVFGLWRPKVILPARARAWPDARLGAVLLHESAHIRRRDVAFQFLARLACALFWFNPLAWLVERKLLVASERAADDHVIGREVSSADYAEHLMDTSAELGTMRGPAWATAAMAEGTAFKDRILSILDPNVRRGEPGAARRALVGLAAAVLVVPLLAFSPWGAAPAASSVRVQQAAAPLPTDTPPGGQVVAQQAGPADVATLLAMLRLEDPSMREHAAEALGERRHPSAVLPLIDVIRRDASASVREHACGALGELGDERAAGPLADVMRNDPDAGVREHAAGALGNLGHPASFEVLLETMRGRDGEQVRAHAAHALGMLGDARALGPLLDALRAEAAVMRSNAALGLGALGGRVVDAKERPWNYPEVPVPDSVREARALIRNRAVEALQRALRDPDSRVRANVREALAMIEWR